MQTFLTHIKTILEYYHYNKDVLYSEDGNVLKCFEK